MQPDAQSPSLPDPQEFRRALGCFPTGVAVVTTLDPDGRPVGLTVSSFNSVSLDPPLVLWSIALRASSLPSFQRNPHFAINVLAVGQSDLPGIFSSRVEDRFAGLDWQPGLHGIPVLPDSAASFECGVYNRCDGGDHEVILGRVLRFAASDRTPLVFGKGRLAPLMAAE
ncbi:flavin reductase family protein [Halovulum dunhuangense]|uniref:Flavin reductase family protein n=1 Tax=Halovulum dunhuangense TaxID=1505036 RepID=A0A849L5J1_9RHOB|nr:flavin reductase family protein [Halovulum dunhuangense]NNU81655.1 flavin reductase family protein [Halovulum dunhuangense]